MRECPVCGNEVEPGLATCRFCGSELAVSGVGVSAVLHKIVNIERGRPVVETALSKMRGEITLARHGNVKVVTLIHGYGSSGKGGRIRIECRKLLDHMVEKGEIRKFIAGEDFHRRRGGGKDLLRRFPGLEKPCSTDFNNRGVTVVEL
jgi:hypothetical protein